MQNSISNNYRILIIVPAYNEEDAISKTLNSIYQTNTEWDILVVNDGSDDDTAKIVSNISFCKLITLPCNMGIGGAVQTGLLYAVKNNYDITVQVDADGQHFSHQIIKIIEPIINNNADAVIGSRFKKKHTGYRSSKTRRAGNQFLYYLNRVLTGQAIKDNTSGFRAFNKESFTFLSEHYPTDYPEPEVVVKLSLKGFIVKEVFTQMQERQGGESSLKWKAVFYLVRILIGILATKLRGKQQA